jgi:hypothetical protein
VLTGHGIEAVAQYRGTPTAKRFISYLASVCTHLYAPWQDAIQGKGW